MIVWITGLSASGKTTLARALIALIKPKLPNIALLDGDVVREIYGDALGYREADRVVQIRRIQRLAKFLEDQGIVVVVAALFARDDLLTENRRLFREYFEVHLKAEVAQLVSRETKRLYQRALAGEISDVVGVDIPWHAPRNPHLVFDVAEGAPPETLAKILESSLFARSI